MPKIVRSLLIVVAVALVVGALTAILTAFALPAEKNAAEIVLVVKAETEACRTALPEAKNPEPIWRACGNGYRCFFCADDRGIMHPVCSAAARSGDQSCD